MDPEEGRIQQSMMEVDSFSLHTYTQVSKIPRVTIPILKLSLIYNEYSC